MPHPLADIQSTLGGWLIVALLAPGLIVLVGIVVAFAASRGRRRGGPVVPAPGYFHVMGIDRDTGRPREATFHADSEAAARGRAEVGGMIVTDVRQVNESTG